MSRVIAERLAVGDGLSARPGAGLQRLVAGWAALGITLSGATQLRIAGQPIGPSELILGSWLLFVLFLGLRRLSVVGSRASVVLGAYWLTVLMLMGFGTLVAVQTGRLHVSSAAHDALAFVYIAMLTGALALRFLDDDDYGYHWYFARMTFFFHVLAAGLLFGLAMALPGLGPIEFWYGPRLRGWSENPNQLALAMAAMPFLGWWLLRRTSGRFGKIACVLGIAVCMIVGIASQSDGLRVAWVASFGAVGSLLFYRVTARGRSRWLHISHVIVPAVVVIIGVFYADAIVEMVIGVADRVYAEGHQGEKRFTLWSHGIQAIGASPLVGFGPGSFSGYNGPFEDHEAHNSFIDWGASTGLTGIVVYLGLLAWAMSRALRSGESTLVGMLIAVVVTSTFSYLLRQPDFWMVIVLVLVLSEPVITVRERQAGRLTPEPGGQAPRLTLRPAPHLHQSSSG